MTAATTTSSSGGPDGTPGGIAAAGLRLDLAHPRRVHLVGVGGAMIGPIASVLTAMGHHVSGSDQADSVFLERLRAEGVDATVGHDARNVESRQPLDAVAVSTAIPADNPEVAAARRLGIPVLSRAEVLAAISATRRTLAISGTHGKTTTSAMLAHVLVKTGTHASYLVGADLHEFGRSAHWDTGELLVVEADESDGTFLQLPRAGVIVTSIEADHLDHYGTFDAIEASFVRFLAETAGPKVVCADDPVAARLAADAGASTYGTSAGADWQLSDVETDRSEVRFVLTGPAKAVAPESGSGGDAGVPGERVRLAVSVPAPGRHNALNATAALLLAAEMGVDLADGVASLAGFGGVSRRFQLRGHAVGVDVIDDYAHNPGKVAAVVRSAAEGGWDRVVCAFQPHRYTRTATLGEQFGQSFVGADVVVVTDVYGAGEAPIDGVSGMTIVRAILDHHPWQRVAYLPGRADVVGFLARELRPGDLCLTVGAGDITSLADELLPLLSTRSQRSGGAGAGDTVAAPCVPCHDEEPQS